MQLVHARPMNTLTGRNRKVAGMKGYGLLAGVLLLGAIPGQAGSAVTLRVSPTMAFAPADLLIRASVGVNPANRKLEVVAESNDYYRSSEIQLDGADAARTSLVAFRSVPGGDYTVRVIVRGSRGEVLASSTAMSHVVDRAPER
jgi:hypothetical protein